MLLFNLRGDESTGWGWGLGIGDLRASNQQFRMILLAESTPPIGSLLSANMPS